MYAISDKSPHFLENHLVYGKAVSSNYKSSKWTEPRPIGETTCFTKLTSEFYGVGVADHKRLITDAWDFAFQEVQKCEGGEVFTFRDVNSAEEWMKTGRMSECWLLV